MTGTAVRGVLLAALGLACRAQVADHPTEIGTLLKKYDRAFSAKDIEELARFYHPEVTIFEGGSTNHGWIDYRDNHLGPELRELQDLELRHVNVKSLVLGGGGAAYVTAEYHLKARVGGRELDAAGLETLVLVRDGNATWRIRHSHTSSVGRPTASPSPKG
jgi:ketosteroid isomerase-like protein